MGSRKNKPSNLGSPGRWQQGSSLNPAVAGESIGIMGRMMLNIGNDFMAGSALGIMGLIMVDDG